ncbi:MAG: phage integrase SAM-like domain-containing protein [Candidatus Roizmanbacteria bacterium]|nr:MAG: phage integrase SAM-like domain-containing protein [Candidatus Roizmanbacteria bacterium]
MQLQYNQYNFESSFKNYLLAEKVKPVTLKNYLSDLRHFLGWLTIPSHINVGTGRDLSLPDETSFITQNLTLETLENYKQYLISNNLPLLTVNRRLSTLRKFCTFCISQGWMKENPAKKISNVKFQMSSAGVGRDRPETMDEANIGYVLKKYKTFIEKEGLSNNQIDKNITDVKDFLQIINS